MQLLSSHSFWTTNSGSLWRSNVSSSNPLFHIGFFIWRGTTGALHYSFTTVRIEERQINENVEKIWEGQRREEKDKTIMFTFAHAAHMLRELAERKETDGLRWRWKCLAKRRWAWRRLSLQEHICFSSRKLRPGSICLWRCLNVSVCKYVYGPHVCVITSMSAHTNTYTHEHTYSILKYLSWHWFGDIKHKLSAHRHAHHKLGACSLFLPIHLALPHLDLSYTKSLCQAFNILEPELSAEETFFIPDAWLSPPNIHTDNAACLFSLEKPVASLTIFLFCDLTTRCCWCPQ